MNQIGFDEEWLYVLDFYVRPLQETVFTGYFHKPPRWSPFISFIYSPFFNSHRSLMNFMVRYRPDEQPFLRPHHDRYWKRIGFAIFIIIFQLHLHHQCGPQPCRSGLRGEIPQKDSIYEIRFFRAAVVDSSDTTAKSQRQRLDGCSCIQDVSPTITKASMWRKAQDTSWSLLLTPEN